MTVTDKHADITSWFMVYKPAQKIQLIPTHKNGRAAENTKHRNIVPTFHPQFVENIFLIETLMTLMVNHKVLCYK